MANFARTPRRFQERHFQDASILLYVSAAPGFPSPRNALRLGLVKGVEDLARRKKTKR